jgi:parvulin-like peptidyl-prolyl isomerase
MQDMMRKHRRALLVVIILLIGVPMLFFGIPAFWEEPDRSMQGAEIGQVGGVPLEAEAYIKNLQMAASQQAQMGQTAPTFQQLDQAGTAGTILQDMISSALMRHEAEQRGFVISQEVEDRILREMSMFKGEDGKFDRAKYETWIQSNNQRGVNWNDIRKNVEEEVAQQVYQQVLLAPAARVLDKEIDEQLVEGATKVQMRYVKVTPPVDVTDDEIQKHYDANLESYRSPAQQVAEFVRIPMSPEVPANAAEVVQRARAGEDFAALANETTSLEVKDGGDLGWLVKQENEMAHRLPLHALAVGEVSEPIVGPGGYFIYKVEEERTNPDTQEREVHARQIFLRAELTPEQREEKLAQANTLGAKAKELGDLAKAAQELGLAVERTGAFDGSGAVVENVPAQDARMFASTLANQPEGEEFSVVTGAQNAYVAHVVETVEGTIPPLDQVRERVREDVVAQKKQEPAYVQRVQEYGDKITAQAKSLADIAAQFPELNAEIKETKPFTSKDYLFQEGIYLQTQEVLAALKDKEPGVLAGPLRDFQGESYFIELANRTEPTEEDKAGWPEERKQLRERAIMASERQLFDDYRKDLRDRRLVEVGMSINEEAISHILGRGEPAEGATPAGDGASSAGEGASPAGDAAPAAEDATPAADAAPAGDAAPAADAAPAVESSAVEAVAVPEGESETAPGS